MQYKVLKIEEDIDFGCEERQPGEKLMSVVLLEREDGCEMSLRHDDELLYERDINEGDKEAKDILIERNLRLVAHIAKKYSSENRDNDDLISIGIIGLIKAVNTFNTGKGSRLATYAAKCIENELLMMLRGEKKKSREVSLNEPIGMDKEGNTINLLDVVEMDEPGALDAEIRKA